MGITWWGIKEWILKHLFEIFIAIAAVIAPIKPLIIAVGFLIFFDLITGLKKAHTLKESITSKRLSDTVTKIIFYNIAIFTSLTIQYITTDIIPVVKLVASGIAAIEGYSIFENISIITGKDFKTILSDILNKKRD